MFIAIAALGGAETAKTNMGIVEAALPLSVSDG